MGEATGVSRWRLTAADHEKCLAWFRGELPIPDKETSPHGDIDRYVLCAEAFNFQGRFNNDCSLFVGSSRQKACREEGGAPLIRSIVLVGMGLLVGIFLVGRRAAAMGALLMLSEQERRAQDPVI